MAMVDVVSEQPKGGPMAQVCRLGPKVSSHLALFCIHRENRGNSRNDSTINIVLVVIIIIIIIIIKALKERFTWKNVVKTARVCVCVYMHISIQHWL